jgi:hypothetical protein
MLALPGRTSEQRTLSKTQNNHLTGKAPYKFESALLQERVHCELDSKRRDRSGRSELGRASKPFENLLRGATRMTRFPQVIECHAVRVRLP